MLSQRQLFLEHLAQTSASPLLLEIGSADGIYLKTVDGKKYMDLIAGVGVSNVGHRHPKVIKAIKSQLDMHLHVMVYGEYIQDPQVSLAEALARSTDNKLNSVYLLNSGSEAVEGAMKLAKRYTGRFSIVSCINAYHGSSQGALSLSGNEAFKRNYRPLLPGVRHIRFGCIDDLQSITEETAAFIAETVQGEAGVKVGSDMYWKAVRQRCNETGALLILDEIQCGAGRTGKLWAFQHHLITPDILVAAKGMGGGMPIGCFMADKKIMHALSENPTLGHITTFGGHPLSSAAALAALKTIEEENLLPDVPQKEKLFQKLLKHPRIKEVRTKGLLIAVEFGSREILRSIIDKALASGIITDWFLYDDRSMRIAPPLIITEEEIKKACKLICRAIDEE